MEFKRGVLVSPTTEGPVVEGQVVTAIRTLAGRGVGKKAIAREVGVAVNTVRRYLRQPIAAGHQVRPAARRLTDDRREEARTLYVRPAAGNVRGLRLTT
jgi:predicted transcriptional regulator